MQAVVYKIEIARGIHDRKKIALSPHDDKRYIVSDFIKILP